MMRAADVATVMIPWNIDTYLFRHLTMEQVCVCIDVQMKFIRLVGFFDRYNANLLFFLN